jgi:ribosomal protein S19
MRSCWKLPYIHIKYFENYFYKNKKFKINYKNSVINPNFLNKKVSIYNGKYLYSFNIKPEMIGFKFGEFIKYKTSDSHVHIKKEKNKKKK